MKNMKKLTAFVSALALAVCAVPANASAEFISAVPNAINTETEFLDWDGNDTVGYQDGYYLINYLEYTENRPITDFSVYGVDIESYIESEGGVEEINKKHDLNGDGVIDKHDFVIFVQLTRGYSLHSNVSGDVNMDGRTDAVDGYMIKYYFEDLEEGNEDYYTTTQLSFFEHRGDANEDGVVDMADADFILSGGYAEKLNSNIEPTVHTLVDGTIVHSGEEFLARKEAYINDDSDLGDVNRDGRVDTLDANMITSYYIDLSTNNYDAYTEEEHEIFRKYGDVFNDGYIDLIDAMWVREKCPEDLTGDLNQDGIVDMEDIEIMREWLYTNPEDFTDEQLELIKTHGYVEDDGTISLTTSFAELTRMVVGNPENTELGDVNHDGFVNAIDATMVCCYYAAYSCNESDYYTEAEHENFATYGDMNDDGRVNSIDASIILTNYAERATE